MSQNEAIYNGFIDVEGLPGFVALYGNYLEFPNLSNYIDSPLAIVFAQIQTDGSVATLTISGEPQEERLEDGNTYYIWGNQSIMALPS